MASASAKVKQRTSTDNQCSACYSEHIMVIPKARYIIMTSVLPLFVTAAIAIIFHLLFLLFIPALVWMNVMIAQRKAPLVVCRECRHTSKGSVPV
ncbi:hypothetical protein [Salsuginibacillus kocurii]|uniref:hypothetical protein n=1 Tax=Salsuginibacillus kocurii TaxID=427078 RepID=UPI000364F00D|nr:hypothetical protein [Salsuginibacillus kocurii]